MTLLTVLENSTLLLYPAGSATKHIELVKILDFEESMSDLLTFTGRAAHVQSGAGQANQP